MTHSTNIQTSEWLPIWIQKVLWGGHPVNGNQQNLRLRVDFEQDLLCVLLHTLIIYKILARIWGRNKHQSYGNVDTGLTHF